jgi:hypothetical protein
MIMDILILVKEAVDEEHLKMVLAGIRKTGIDLDWFVTRDLLEWRSRIPAFKILANGEQEGENVLYADLVWEAPSRFMKTNTGKLRVFNDITETVQPAFAQKIEKKNFLIKERELYSLLEKINSAESPFVVTTHTGTRIGIGQRSGVDYSITHGDLASMLAACAVLNGVAVTID